MLLTAQAAGGCAWPPGASAGPSPCHPRPLPWARPGSCLPRQPQVNTKIRPRVPPSPRRGPEAARPALGPSISLPSPDPSAQPGRQPPGPQQATTRPALCPHQSGSWQVSGTLGPAVAFFSSAELGLGFLRSLYCQSPCFPAPLSLFCFSVIQDSVLRGSHTPPPRKARGLGENPYALLRMEPGLAVPISSGFFPLPLSLQPLFLGSGWVYFFLSISLWPLVIFFCCFWVSGLADGSAGL